MQIMAEFQKRHDRELMLDRKELAAILLSGEGENRQEINDLASRAGLQRLPDRVMAIQVRHAAREGDTPTRISSQASLGRLSHAAEGVGTRHFSSLHSLTIVPVIGVKADDRPVA
jgi:hypothetical protein